MIKTIVASINLLIVAVRGGFKIYAAATGEGTIGEKTAKIHVALQAILEKLKALAAATEPEWDDALAETLAEIEKAIAENLIEQLG